MKTKMTKKEISHLYQSVTSKSMGLYRGIKFAYTISKNSDFLEKPFNEMVKACYFDEDVRLFVKKWVHLNGQDMIDQMNIELEKDPSLKDLVERSSSKVKSNIELLDQVIEVDIYKIHMHDLPEDIRSEDYTKLKRLIIIPEEEKL